MAKKPILSDEQKEAILGPLVHRKTPPWNKKDIAAPKEPEPDREPLDVAGTVVAEMDKMPDLNHRQRNIAYLLSRRLFTQGEIAIKIGCSQAYVGALATDDRIKRQIEIFRGGEILEFAEAVSAQEILDKASVRAAELLAEKMEHALDEKTQVQAAIKILSLTGHTDKTDGPAVQIVIDRGQLDTYRQAKEEAKIVDVDFEVQND